MQHYMTLLIQQHTFGRTERLWHFPNGQFIWVRAICGPHTSRRAKAPGNETANPPRQHDYVGQIVPWPWENHIQCKAKLVTLTLWVWFFNSHFFFCSCFRAVVVTGIGSWSCDSKTRVSQIRRSTRFFTTPRSCLSEPVNCWYAPVDQGVLKYLVFWNSLLYCWRGSQLHRPHAVSREPKSLAASRVGKNDTTVNTHQQKNEHHMRRAHLKKTKWNILDRITILRSFLLWWCVSVLFSCRGQAHSAYSCWAPWLGCRKPEHLCVMVWDSLWPEGFFGLLFASQWRRKCFSITACRFKSCTSGKNFSLHVLGCVLFIFSNGASSSATKTYGTTSAISDAPPKPKVLNIKIFKWKFRKLLVFVAHSGFLKFWSQGTCSHWLYFQVFSGERAWKEEQKKYRLLFW